MNSGYIKLHRKILENPVVMKTPDHLAVWLYLLLNATHKGYDTMLEGQRITLKPGQLITGRKAISKALKINESKIQRLLKMFEIEQQIEQLTNPRCRLISILNWNEYQYDEQQSKRQMNNKRTLYKNVKNDKNTYSDGFQEFWSLYPKKVSKKKSYSSYKTALKTVNHEKIMGSLNDHLGVWEAKEVQFIPHASTWLNQERFNDVMQKPEEKIEVVKQSKYLCPSCDSEKIIKGSPKTADLYCECEENMYISEWEYNHRKAQDNYVRPEPVNDDIERLKEITSSLTNKFRA